MNADEYYKKQEDLKKLFELALDEGDKTRLLEKMLTLEMEYHTKDMKTPQESSHQDVHGNFYNLYHKGSQPKVESKDDILFMKVEKLTPENVFSQVKITDSNGKQSSDLIEALKKDPKFAKKLCDIFNQAALSNMKKRLGNDIKHYEKFDDGRSIGYRKAPALIVDKRAEANRILEQAQAARLKAPKPKPAPEMEKPQKGKERTFTRGP